MSGIGIFSLISLILTVLLLQRTDIRFVANSGEPYRIDIELTIFGVTFVFDKNDFKRKNKKSIKSRIKTAKFALYFVKRLISRSYITLYALNITAEALKTSPPLLIGINILKPIILAYVSERALSFEEKSPSLGDIHVEFSFYLYSLFISLGMTLYHSIKSVIKEKVKNAG